MSEFLAEASVRIVPDTSTFRVELERELRTATAKPIPVTVTPVVAATGTQALAAQTAAASAATGQLASIAAQASTTGTAVAASTRKMTDAQRLGARAANLLAVANEEVLNVTSEVARAQITATRTASALAVARRAEGALTRSDTAETAQNTVATLANAEAMNVQAQAALRSSQANAAAATSMSALSRGAGATGLSLLGVRGATLAANSAFLAGAAAVAGFGKAIGTAVDFESQLAVFAATTGATATEMDRVSESARQLGQDITLPAVTAGSAAEAMTELARAGLSVSDSIEGARGVLQLATAAQLSNADATQLAASALNAFGLDGTQAVRVADLLANAANEAQGGIEEMGLALRQSAGVARQVGISLDDTVALLTLLARNGLQGSDAGTALRTSLIRLINPTKEAKDVLAELNVQLRDQQGNIRPEVFAEFAAAQANLSRQQQDANAAIVFGQDAIRALAILGREGAEGLSQTSKALEVQGTAARIAGARMTGLRGSTENLSNQLGDLGLTLGESVTPALEDTVDNLAHLVVGLREGVDAAKELKGALGDIPGGDFLGDFISDPVRFFAPMTQLVDDADETKENMKNAGADLRSAIEDAGREASQGAQSFGDQIVDNLNAAFQAVNDAISRARQVARNASIRAIGGLGGQQAGLEEQFSGILAGGAPLETQIANLRRQAQVQARIIERAGPDAAGVVLEARRRARERLAQINGQIVGLEDQIRSERDRAASEAQQRREDADRSFLDAISVRERRVDTQAIVAEGTESLADDNRVLVARRQLLRDQIAQIDESLNDRKRAAELMAQKRQEILQVENRIAENNRAILEQRAERREDAFQAQIDLAEAEGNIPRQIQFIQIRIRKINELIAAGKAEGAALNRLKAERATLQQQRDALQDQRLQEETDLGQSIFDLTGNKNPLLRGLNAQIADTQREIKAARAQGKATTVLQTELNRLKKQRKDLLEEEEKEGGGTTLADLFRQTQDIARSASTVGQTAASLTSAAANAPIRAEVQRRLEIQATLPPGAQSQQQRQAAATERLITSIDRLADVFTSGGNDSTATPRRPAQGGLAFQEAVREAQRATNARVAARLAEHGI